MRYEVLIEMVENGEISYSEAIEIINSEVQK